MAKRVALWLTSSSMPRMKLFEDAPPSTNTKVHVTLVSALVRQPRDIEILVDKVKKLSASLKFNNVTVQPPIGTNTVPTLEADKSRLCIPLAASIELENLHEISALLIEPEEVRAPYLSFLSRLTADFAMALLHLQPWDIAPSPPISLSSLTLLLSFRTGNPSSCLLKALELPLFSNVLRRTPTRLNSSSRSILLKVRTLEGLSLGLSGSRQSLGAEPLGRTFWSRFLFLSATCMIRWRSLWEDGRFLAPFRKAPVLPC